MNDAAASDFGFDPGLPIDPVERGTNLLVDGPSGRGAREVGLRLIASGSPETEGRLLISADVGGLELLERYEATAGRVDRSAVAVLDCSGTEDDRHRFDPRFAPVAGPGDLAGIQLEFSNLYETLADRNFRGVRIGVFSASSLLAHGDARTVSRFLHVLTGRVIATGDLGVFVVDPALTDDRLVETVAGFCDGRVQVRSVEDGAAGSADDGTAASTDETGDEAGPDRWSGDGESHGGDRRDDGGDRGAGADGAARYELRTLNFEDRSEKWVPVDAGGPALK